MGKKTKPVSTSEHNRQSQAGLRRELANLKRR